MKKPNGTNKASGGFTDWNQNFIYNSLKVWKRRAEQAASIIRLYQNCKRKSDNPRDFFYEVRSEQIINKRKL